MRYGDVVIILGLIFQISRKIMITGDYGKLKGNLVGYSLMLIIIPFMILSKEFGVITKIFGISLVVTLWVRALYCYKCKKEDTSI